ncbi:MAG: hypothetical protein ACOYD7_06255 [Raoultibacter sp.]|jgi:hypothetical protein
MGAVQAWEQWKPLQLFKGYQKTRTTRKATRPENQGQQNLAFTRKPTWSEIARAAR